MITLCVRLKEKQVGSWEHMHNTWHLRLSWQAGLEETTAVQLPIGVCLTLATLGQLTRRGAREQQPITRILHHTKPTAVHSTLATYGQLTPRGVFVTSTNSSVLSTGGTRPEANHNHSSWYQTNCSTLSEAFGVHCVVLGNSELKWRHCPVELITRVSTGCLLIIVSDH
jgi:hypothetical protein